MNMDTLDIGKEKRLVPVLRFKEFDGEWKKNKLANIGKVSMCKRIMKDQTSPTGDIPFYKIGTFGKQADAFINKELYEEFKNKYSYPKKGDVLIAASGATYGKTVVFDGNPAFFQDSNIVWIDNDETKINNTFLSIIYLIVKWAIQTSTIPRLYNDIIRNTSIFSPSLPEQQKIATFLSTIDKKIQQLTRKKALLEQYKKGVMQQLFSGALRFQDEEGKDYPDWEEKRLGEVLTIGSGKDYKHLGKGSIPVFGTGGYMLSVDKMLHDGETVFIGRKGTINKPFYFKGPFWTVDTLFYTHKFKSVIPGFIYVIFQQINWKLYNEASGVPSLSKSTIESIKSRFPCIEEQTKITRIFSTIDTKIETITTQITKTQTFKKGLLQQLFV